MSRRTEVLLDHMFRELGRIVPEEAAIKKIATVIDRLTRRAEEFRSLDTPTKLRFRSMLCGIAAYGFLEGMCPKNAPGRTINGQPIFVPVTDDELVPLEAIKDLRYEQADDGSCSLYLDPNTDALNAVDAVLDEIETRLWPKEAPEERSE